MHVFHDFTYTYIQRRLKPYTRQKPTCGEREKGKEKGGETREGKRDWRREDEVQ